MIRRMVLVLIGLTLVTSAAIGAAVWFTFRVYVPEDMCAVLIRKTGKSLPPGQLVATEDGQMGIQEKVLGPGRYFYNPYSWDHELHPQTKVPSGNPATWEWSRTLTEVQRSAIRANRFAFKGEFPMIGVVARKVGKEPPPGEVIVKRDSGLQGILEEVLTPGTYKINPYVYNVELHPASIIPAGFVGVVTNLFAADDSAAVGVNSKAQTESADAVDAIARVRPLSDPGQRGTLRDVLQPGLYFINPKLQKVTLVEIGFNEYSQMKISETENYRISFPSDTGYNIRVDVTVIWGIHPQHAAEIINEFGNVDFVLDKVIGPQLRSIGRNIGSTYAARDFIQGEKREQFQLALTEELQRVCRAKNLEVLLALVHEIEVSAPSALSKGEESEDLKRTIQESFIAIEQQLTNEKKREAATVRAKLEEERKKVDIARETIKAETRVMVAKTLADADKQAAEIDAQAALDVASIQEQVAQLDAQRIEILGKAGADVEKMKKEADAKGYEMLIGAFGSGQAYNLYTFAENFKPESIRLFFAGEGTFWTDLSRFEELGAAKLLKPQTPAKEHGEPSDRK